MAETEIRELDKTLQVDGKAYNINAKTADVSGRVVNKLVVKKTNLTGETSENSSIAFDGSSDKELVIVSADGGGFRGRVTVPDFTNQKMDPKAVLNSSDIKKFIVDELEKTSVLCTWDGESLVGGGDGSSIKSISIITGPDSKVNALAQKIYDTGSISAYIYISNDNEKLGNIYFGTCDSNTVAGVRVSAENAITAEKLKNSQTFIANLASYDAGSFNGTAAVSLGIKSDSILPKANGGTGANNLDNVTVGKAKQLATSRKILVALNSPNAAKFDGTKNITPGIDGVLQASNGGTGASKLDDVTVGKAKSMAIYTKSDSGISKDPSYTSAKIILSTYAPADTEGANGDIWIKYS